jgi:hypothetical protein
MSSNYVPKGKDILYAYITKENREYVKDLEQQTNQTTSYIVDQILTSLRTDSEIVLEERIPKYVEKARQFEQKKKKARRKATRK